MWQFWVGLVIVVLIFVQTKKGWLVGLGQEGHAWVGGTVQNILKGGTEKTGGAQGFQKGGPQAGCLKKRGAGTPL